MINTSSTLKTIVSALVVFEGLKLLSGQNRDDFFPLPDVSPKLRGGSLNGEIKDPSHKGSSDFLNNITSSKAVRPPQEEIDAAIYKFQKISLN